MNEYYPHDKKYLLLQPSSPQLMATPFLRVLRPKLRVPWTAPCPPQVCVPASMHPAPPLPAPLSLPCLSPRLPHSPYLSSQPLPPTTCCGFCTCSPSEPVETSAGSSFLLSGPPLAPYVSESKAEARPQPHRLSRSGSNPSGLTYHPLPWVQPQGPGSPLPTTTTLYSCAPPLSPAWFFSLAPRPSKSTL